MSDGQPAACRVQRARGRASAAGVRRAAARARSAVSAWRCVGRHCGKCPTRRAAPRGCSPGGSRCSCALQLDRRPAGGGLAHSLRPAAQHRVRRLERREHALDVLHEVQPARFLERLLPLVPQDGLRISSGDEAACSTRWSFGGASLRAPTAPPTAAAASDLEATVSLRVRLRDEMSSVLTERRTDSGVWMRAMICGVTRSRVSIGIASSPLHPSVTGLPPYLNHTVSSRSVPQRAVAPGAISAQSRWRAPRLTSWCATASKLISAHACHALYDCGVRLLQ